MVFSSTLQLRILGNQSLDKMLAESRADSNASSKLHGVISTEGTWHGIKREQHLPYLNPGDRGPPPHATYMADHDVGSSPPHPRCEWSGIPTSAAVSEAPSSDWNVLSSTSFDETYLECAYTESSSGMTATHLPAAMEHFEDPVGRRGAGEAAHEPPLISSPYPGTSWFLGGKSTTGSGLVLPAMEELTLGGPAASIPSSIPMIGSSSPFNASPCTPSFPSDPMATYPEKIAADGMASCSPEAPSPVQMESFVPCMPYPMEPTELLFEDVHSWTGASVEMYDQPHSQPPYTASTSQCPASNECVYFNSTGATMSSMAMGPHDYVSSYLAPHASAAMPEPSSYHTTQQVASSQWMSNDPQQPYFTPLMTKSSTEMVKPFTTTSTKCSFPVSRSERHTDSVPRRVLRSSTLSRRAASRPQSTGVLSKMTPPQDKALPVSSCMANQASIELLTTLNDCYWKNGRKNLQCFPSCPEHHDFYSMKMNNRKHSSVGVCRGPVYCHAITAAADFHPAASTQLKLDQKPGGASVSELFVLGRFERVPQQESTNLLEELHPPPSFCSTEDFEQFRYNCFQAVEMEERRVQLPEAVEDSKSDTGRLKPDKLIRSTWFFLPDVWKVQPMLKKKRKATRSAPAQTFPFCFRVFVYRREVSGGFTCLADAASSFFELYSTRTVDRVKRKYWSGANEAGQSKRSKRR